jgi:ubiquinone/menaquinone biosynthesis C-methylase UbiE
MPELAPPSLDQESRFHDNWAAAIDPGEVMVDASFEACTMPENRRIRQWLGDISGLSLLELGCGAGEASVFFSKQGARVTATDLSPGMLRLAKSVARVHGVSINAMLVSADSIGAADASFDVVYAANVLHHTDLTKALDEIVRVLKPGGVFVAWDPLAHNPVINVYRRMARQVRTADEHPLTMSQVRSLKRWFVEVDAAMTWLSTLTVFLKFYFIDRIDPNQERYWKKIITDHEQLASQYNFFERLDKWLLRMFPFLRRYCWNVVIKCTKAA